MKKVNKKLNELKQKAEIKKGKNLNKKPSESMLKEMSDNADLLYTEQMKTID